MTIDAFCLQLKNVFNFGDDPDHCSDPGVQNPDSPDSWRSAEVCAL